MKFIRRISCVFLGGFLHLLSATPSELQGEVNPQTDLLSRASAMRPALVFALLVAATQVSFFTLLIPSLRALV
jgi:hypothetical protein